jgi:prepilin signal peptidase PulO-like enzyme (type II secretory pathway)
MAIAFVLVGLAVGSFLNVCIDRLPAGQSLFKPRSHCPACETPLAARDLIPVASYLFLRGKCRYCSAPIPTRVLLVEAGTGLSFLLLWWRFGLSTEMALAAVVLCAIIVIAVIVSESRAVAGRVRRICNDTRRRG